MTELSKEMLPITNEEINLLNKIFSDKDLPELYAIHYIESRMSLCSWMTIPDRDDKFWAAQESFNSYIKTYEEKIKPNLTQDIINAICCFDEVGSDLIEVDGKGYNLCKIFDYYSTDGNWDEYPAYYEVKPRESNTIYTPFDYISKTLKFSN